MFAIEAGSGRKLGVGRKETEDTGGGKCLLALVNEWVMEIAGLKFSH